MSLEQTVRDTSAALRSERVTERRRSAEALKDLLTPVSGVLSTNQLRGSGLSWDNVFDDVHEFALKECEKFETNRAFNTSHQICSSLLYQTIIGSNKGMAYIKSEKVIDACLQILQSPRLTKAFGDVYVNMMHKYVMPVDHYLRFFTPQTWEDLLNSCVSISCRDQSDVDLLTLLRLILQIMQKGPLYCHFVIPVRDIIPKLRNIYAHPNQEIKVQEVLLCIGIQLMEILSSESRLTISEFTEAVIPGLLKYYEHNADNKKKSLLFHFLELAVMVHHPRGRLENDEGSLANEWPVWNQHLLSIVELVTVEGNFLERTMSEGKFKFHSDLGRGELCQHYVKLAALVFYQVIQSRCCNSMAGDCDENLAKKPRLQNVNTFNDLILKLRELPVPWMSVITAYIRLYSETISTMDSAILLSVLENYISYSIHKINWTDFGRSACSILKKLASAVIVNEPVVLIIQTLWNSCVRYSSVDSAAHRPIHTIMQSMIELDLVDKINLPQLLKLYKDGAMIVTLDSVATLNHLFRKYETKLNENDNKLKYLVWSKDLNLDSSNEPVFEELMLHLTTKESCHVSKKNCDANNSDHLFSVAFENTEDIMLASEFEIGLWKEPSPKISKEVDAPTLQICNSSKEKVNDFLVTKLKLQMDKFEKDKIISIDLMNHLRLSLAYHHNLLKFNICNTSSMEDDNLWKVTCHIIDAAFSGMGKYFDRVPELSDKTLIVKSMISLLSNDHHIFIERRLRNGADEDFFRVLYGIINHDDDKTMKTVDDGFDAEDARHEDLRGSVLELCAFYCKSEAQFREDVLELILDPKLYNFSAETDVKIAFRCIEILCDENVVQKPIEHLFRFMQAMCKSLFRNSEAAIHILKLLYPMLEEIGDVPTETMKNNCIIMLRGYLHRCQTAYYPPCVAALVYKCIAKIEALKHQQWNNTLRDTMVKGLYSPLHSVRLYTCYVIKDTYCSMSENHLKIFLTDLLAIFEVEVSTESREMLKDEAVNRTSTVLHCIVALALARPMWMTKLIAALVEIAKAKSIDRKLIGKVLDLIVINITGRPTHEYLKSNLLPLLYYWFNMKISVHDISYWYFGYDNIDHFFREHMNWLIPAEVYCNNEGSVGSSSLLLMLKNAMNIEEDKIINHCFSNILALSLPHSVHEKYKVACPTWMKVDGLQATGNRMFKSSMEWFGVDKISKLYEEHFGSVILQSTMMLMDPMDIAEKFNWVAPISTPEPFNYSLQTYELVLKYFGEIVGGCIMQNICENMPLAISSILLNLWSQIESENVLESKLICLHRYVVFFAHIPLTTRLDGYICNFMCCTLLNTLRACYKDGKKKESTGMVCRALNITLSKILPDKLMAIDKIIPQLISTLIMMKHDNKCAELEELLSFLLNDMEYCPKNSIDLVDAACALTQGKMDSSHSSLNFIVSLKNFIPKLTCYSLETLNNVKAVITTQKAELLVYCDTLKQLKGFSEDCQNSVIHQLINSLTNIATNSADPKCIVAACDCLALIGPCNLRTLITSTPESQDKIVCVNPSQYMSLVALHTLSENVFDEHPMVIQKTTKALKSLLSYREGKIALEQSDLKSHHLQPFVSKRKNHSAVKCAINNDNFTAILKTQSIWIPINNENHEAWLTKVVSTLTNVLFTENNYFSELYEVCKLKPSLADKLIPPLFGLIVSHANEAQLMVLSMQLTAFFQYFYQKTYCSSQDHNAIVTRENSLHLMDRHKSSVEAMLRVVDFVRVQRLQYKNRAQDELGRYNYLRLNYETVAWAACLAGHSAAAVLYGELWCVERCDGAPPGSPTATAALPHGERVQNMFRKSYVAIGESDAVYGCGTGHLSNEGEKLNHILRMGHFGDALLLHDVALSHTPAHHDTQVLSLQRGVIRSFYKSGLYHIAVQYMKALPDDNDLDDVKFECYSNLGDWSLIVDKSSLEIKNTHSISKLESIIKAYQYVCLKDCLTIAITDGYESRLQVPLDSAKLAVANFLKKSNIENCQVIYNVTSILQLFQEIEEYYIIRCKKQPVIDLISKWDVAMLMPFDDFKHIEPVLSQRSLILQHAANLESILVDDIINLQLKYAELAMANNRQQLSTRLVAMAQRLRPGGMVSLMDSRVLWANGHKDIALHLIKSIINDATCIDRILRANALRQFGSWMVELRYESSRDILHKYLKGSLDTLGEGGHMETQLKVYLDLARFADAEYKQVLAYTKSSIFENKVKCMQNMRGTASSIKELQSQQPISKDEQRALHTNERLSKYEEAEITSTYKEKKSFLDLAMKYYLLTLSKGDLSDLSIFRVISLWIDNPGNEFEDKEDSLEYLLNAVPSRKYLPVLPQIAPRLTKEKSSFSSVMNHTIIRCAMDHPHHTLPILFALSNSHKDQAFLNTKTHEEPRVIAARSMIQHLAKADSLEAVIQQMDQMNNALISLAYYKSVDGTQAGSRHAVPRSEPLLKLRNLDSVLVPIFNLAVNRDCTYTDITSVVSFSNNYSLVGGINAPKKIMCKGSDGIERTILLKGEDDLRQDAVMQQVFTIVNSFLEMNQETSRRKLIIRTYKVVPLSRRSGVLEWCEGTETLGGYLIGNSNCPGAHVRYRPKDVTPSAARSMLDRAKSKENKLAVFKKLLSQFKPVFHHFFTENFLAPVTWYERRLAYTKSVATSSMVGYMLGLGDRHVQNILIDKKSAEVVHIDFGIAFDQGRALPTPETVPFRLTQDIVAGFGACGVDGVFRRCCEKTLQLLQDQQETLLTILEVLLCDPLYTWTVSAEQAKRKQNIPATPKQNIPATPRDSTLGAGDSGGGANLGSGGPAERALLAVRSKLCGTEGSAGGGMAVPGIVARLLLHATDHSKLAQLYVGWQAYL